MVEWIEPLELEKILVNTFSGSPEIFTGIALIAISFMLAYFRSTPTVLLFILALFVLMFAETISSPIFILLAILGGLSAGFVISKFADR